MLPAGWVWARETRPQSGAVDHRQALSQDNLGRRKELVILCRFRAATFLHAHGAHGRSSGDGGGEQ